MMILTPENALRGDCDFLSANLSARSVFGEDALANVSLEKAEDGSISGHVRIRSKTQHVSNLLFKCKSANVAAGVLRLA